MIKCEGALLRVLSRGGMLVSNAETYRVYRTKDARRGCAGLLSRETFVRLKAEGVMVGLCETGRRWGWCDGVELGSIVPVAPAMARADARRAGAMPVRSTTVLEAVLKTTQDQREADRLARAVMRFLQDYEAQAIGPSTTMNWSFELSGHKGGHRGGMAGMPERSLSAKAVLSQISDVLGESQFAMIECALIKQYSQRRLCSDFGMGTENLLKRLKRSLQQLAHIYDHCIRATA